MAEIFSSGWEGGSDYLNTGGVGVWTGIFPDGAELSRNTTDPLRDAADLKYDGQADHAIYKLGVDPYYSTTGARCFVKLTTDGIGNGQYIYFMTLMNVNSPLFGVRFFDNNGQLQIMGRTSPNGSTWYTVGTAINISLNTVYQVEMKFIQNTMVGFKVWNEAGDTQIGATQEDTDPTHVRDLVCTRFSPGASMESVTSQTVYQMDDCYWVDDGYPGPVVAAGAVAPTAVLDGPLVGPLGGPI